MTDLLLLTDGSTPDPEQMVQELETRIARLGTPDSLTTEMVTVAQNIRLWLEQADAQMSDFENSTVKHAVKRALVNLDEFEARIGLAERAMYLQAEVIDLSQQLVAALVKQRNDAVEERDDALEAAERIFYAGADSGYEAALDDLSEGYANEQYDEGYAEGFRAGKAFATSGAAVEKPAALHAEPDPATNFEEWIEWHNGLDETERLAYIDSLDAETRAIYLKWYGDQEAA